MRDNRLFIRIKEGLSDMLYVWKKEMVATVADQGVLLFFIVVPLLYPLLYSWIYTNEVVRNVPVVVVDQDNSHLSRQYIREVDASPDVSIGARATTLEAAKQLVGDHAGNGVLLIPEGFARKVGRGEQAHVGVYCDMSLMLAYKAIYSTAQAVALDMGAHIQVQRSHPVTERDEQLATAPLEVKDIMMFNTTGGYGNAIIPAVLMLILQQTLLLGIGMGAGTARENNRYQDLVPISQHYNGIFRIVLGKASAYFLIFIVMGTYLGLVVPRLFDFTALNQARYFFPFIVPYILSVIFFGMTCSCMVHYRENVILLVVFTSVPFLFLAGVSWPGSNIPAFWETIGWVFPSTAGVRGYVRLSSMGATLHDVRTEYIVLWSQTFLYFVTTCLVYRYQILRAHRRSAAYLAEIEQQAAAVKARKANH